MKNFIKNISNQELDSISMKMSELINNDEYQEYFTELSSVEHYRLLSHISNNINNSVLIDVGTLKGSSALALSTNKSNSVYSFNLHDELQLNSFPENINFIIGDILDEQFLSLILESKIILLDTFHDGSFEKRFYNYLKSIGYKGVLILDDIKLNTEMVEFWDSIEDDKDDITHIGHITGTGIVYFN